MFSPDVYHPNCCTVILCPGAYLSAKYTRIVKIVMSLSSFDLESLKNKQTPCKRRETCNQGGRSIGNRSLLYTVSSAIES